MPDAYSPAETAVKSIHPKVEEKQENKAIEQGALK